MKKLLVFVLISLIGTSAVVAQTYRSNRNVPQNDRRYHQERNTQFQRGQDNSDRAILNLQNDIRIAINRGVETRQLSQKEAKRYLREYDRISQKEIKLRARNGLNNREERQLVNELSQLRSQVYNQVNVRDNRRTAGRWR